MGVLHMDMSKWPSRFKTRTESGTSLIQLESTDNNIVYTPLKAVNSMLDLLPKEIWSNTDAKFLDPCCKSGIFLEQIFWRLDEGLKHKIPDFLERSDHILTKQLYGLSPCWEVADVEEKLKYSERYHNKALYGTENVKSYAENCRYLLYGAARANDKNAFTRQFDNPYGNIRAMYRIVDGKFKDTFRIIKGDTAYELKELIKEVFGEMKFDVIIGTPPYQESTGEGTQARALYHEFVEKSMELKPTYISMIIPSKWFGGGMNLSSFRERMMNNEHIEKYVHYFDAKECFPGVVIAGGVGYFLYNKEYTGDCQFYNIKNNVVDIKKRKLSAYNFVVADNKSTGIIDKVLEKKEMKLQEIVNPISLFGLPTTTKYRTSKSSDDDIKLYTGGNIGYISRLNITKGKEYIDAYCAMIGSAISGNADQYDNMKVFTRAVVKRPGEVSTQAYIMIGKWDNKETAENCVSYLKTKLCRFLLQATLSSIRISADKFCFVPMQDFSKPWTDAELYAKYNLTQEEIDFIESTIKPMK